MYNTVYFAGHLDPGECEEEAAIREVEEETGLKLSDLSVYHGFRRDVQVYNCLILHKDFFFFFMPAVIQNKIVLI